VLNPDRDEPPTRKKSFTIAGCYWLVIERYWLRLPESEGSFYSVSFFLNWSYLLLPNTLKRELPGHV